MNRVAAALAQTERQVSDRMNSGQVTAAQAAALAQSLDMTPGEYCRFQEIKSLAAANGTLTSAEGQTVYALLGTTPEHYNRQPVHVKAVLTQLFAQLLRGVIQT